MSDETQIPLRPFSAASAWGSGSPRSISILLSHYATYFLFAISKQFIENDAAPHSETLQFCVMSGQVTSTDHLQLYKPPTAGG